MMRLNEFPTEDELKVMVAEVDQVGTIEERKPFFAYSAINTVLHCTHMYVRGEFESKRESEKTIILPCYLLKPPREGVLRSSSLKTLGPQIIMSFSEATGSS
jgi:hypothetical protein